MEGTIRSESDLDSTQDLEKVMHWVLTYDSLLRCVPKMKVVREDNNPIEDRFGLGYIEMTDLYRQCSVGGRGLFHKHIRETMGKYRKYILIRLDPKCLYH
jgi:hypothetical protein